jgi:hypothetical protein
MDVLPVSLNTGSTLKLRNIGFLDESLISSIAYGIQIPPCTAPYTILRTKMLIHSFYFFVYQTQQ